MQNIRKCPYCGGEVEVVKLNLRPGETEFKYRISCMHCKMTVARGLKFEKETDKEGQERIDQYNENIKKKFERLDLHKLYDNSHKASGKDLMIAAGVI